MTENDNPPLIDGHYTKSADQIIAPFWDLFENGNDGGLELTDFVLHCGFDSQEYLSAVDEGWAEVETMILGRYRVRPGLYDVQPLADSLLTYPPIAAEIARLQREKVSKKYEQDERRKKARAGRKRKATTRR
jgi:hypothetical protein